MEYFVYVIKSLNNDNIYVGMTNNLERRLNEHNSKKSKSTKPYAPFKVIYYEKVENSRIARIKEKFLKSGQWRQRIKENYV